jgi:hypothetical protein
MLQTPAREGEIHDEEIDAHLLRVHSKSGFFVPLDPDLTQLPNSPRIPLASLFKRLGKKESLRLAPIFIRKFHEIQTIRSESFHLDDNDDVMVFRLETPDHQPEWGIYIIQPISIPAVDESNTTSAMRDKIQNPGIWKLTLLLVELACQKPISDIRVEGSKSWTAYDKISKLVQDHDTVLENKVHELYKEAVLKCWFYARFHAKNHRSITGKMNEVISLIEQASSKL